MKLRYLTALFLLLLPIRLSAGDEQGLQEFRSGSFGEILQSAKGRPAIIHFWGATCAPCLVELPDWGKFAATRPDANVNIVHAEPMPHNRRLVTEILAKSGLAHARNWAFGEDSHERLRFEIDPEWQGELPMTVLLAANGERRVIMGPAEFDEIQHWLAVEAMKAVQPKLG